MRTNHKWIASLVTGSILLAGPVTTFAATAETKATTVKSEAAITTDITEEDVLNAIDNAASPMPAMRDGLGGGMSSIMPYYGGGVMVDTSITKEVTPDFVAINAYCDTGKRPSREQAKDAIDQIYNSIKNAVGKDGRVRKMGTMSVYPIYGTTGEDTGSFSGNATIYIRVVNMSAALRISDIVENSGCTTNWDVRLVDMQVFELSIIDDLTTRLNKRKKVFEKLLNKRLTNVLSASLNTWVDGYSSYDPETNKADATTTLSISFDLGRRAPLPTATPVPMPMEKAMPLK